MKKFLLLLMFLFMAGATVTQAQDGTELPPVPVNEGWIVVDQFRGVNQLFPPDKLGPQDAHTLINFVPYGIHWLKKREGYKKIYFTERGATHGLAIADSSNTQSRLVVVGDDDLYFTDENYNWELQDFGNTTAEATFFTSTPFGLVISNDGSDAARLWDGISTTSIENLGSCDTATISDTATTGTGTDTLQIMTNGVWVTDHWIGYFIECGVAGVTRYLIIDSDTNSITAIGAACDTCVADSVVEIFAQPDSTTSGLTYPKGQATAYCYDRFFVSSKWYPWRIWYSQERLINEIDIDAFINLDMDAQDKIQAMRVFNNHLIAFGEYSTYGVDNSLVAYSISKAVGCVAPKTVALGDDYIYFLSHRGVYRFKGNIYGSFSYKFDKISDPIQKTIDGIDPNYLEDCGGIYTDKQYWLSYHPDSCMVFDERTNQWYGPQTFGFSDALNYTFAFSKTWDENLPPDADGDSVEWRPSTGSDHYVLVDDIEDDTDYVWTTKDDSLEFFTLTNTNRFPTGGQIEYVAIYIRSKKYTYCSGDIKVYVVANEERYLLGTITVSPPWSTDELQVATNPVTSTAWVKGDLDSLEIGLETVLNESCSFRRIYVSGLRVTPRYRGDFSAGEFLFGGKDKVYLYQYGGIATDDTSSDSTYNVSGVAITATYRSGWFNTGSPVHQYQMRELWIDKHTDCGEAKGDSMLVYIYSDRSSTARDTITFSSTSDAAELEYPTPRTAGHDFSIKLETTADSCFLKSWGALIRDLGKRK